MSDLIERLENWGIAQRSYWSPGRCASIEGRYIRERLMGEDWDTKRTPKLMIDRRDADEVERAYRWMSVDDLETLRQKVLKMHYIHRAPIDFACRRLAIRRSWDDRYYLLELDAAHREIKDLLQRKYESCNLSQKVLDRLAFGAL